MFSILVCSVNASYLAKLKINIHETIGHVYELLAWDNLAEPKSITEVYNLLSARAKYPFWCFIHEDIQFQTNNWSVHIKTAFDQNPGTGLIGIAGAKYKSRTPSGWSTGIRGLDYCNIFHQDKNGLLLHLYNNPNLSIFESVVNVDGVFLAIRKEVWKSSAFSEKLLRGFHLYDIDFSFHIEKNWKAAVVFNIDILHFTEGGSFGNEWLEYTLLWHKHFANDLPQSVNGFQVPKGIEKKIGKNLLYRLHSENISQRNKWKWIKASKIWLDLTAWPYIGLFFFGKY